ncbi:MAG: hypothetical protein RL610_656, partial [Pseudomonadota bacterium]
MRCSKPKHFAWPVVKSFYRQPQLLLSNVSQIHPLGEVLPEQSIAVLVQSALLRAVGMSEIDICFQICPHEFMPHKFFTVVECDGVAFALVWSQQTRYYGRYTI